MGSLKKLFLQVARILAGILICTIGFMWTPQLVSAAACAADHVYVSIPITVTEGGVTKTSNCVPNNSTDVAQNPIFVWLTDIIAFLNVGVGIAVVAGIIYGAIVYTTAGGNPAQTKKAVGIITNSIVSLVLYIMLFAIVNFIVPGGVLK